MDAIACIRQIKTPFLLFQTEEQQNYESILFLKALCQAL